MFRCSSCCISYNLSYMNIYIFISYYTIISFDHKLYLSKLYYTVTYVI